MSEYMTEEEQLLALTKWWMKYWRIIVCIGVVIIGGTAGYRYWNWRLQQTNERASEAYERLIHAVSTQDQASARAYANQLTHKFQTTVYSDVAHLSLASDAIQQSKWEEAKRELKQVLDKGHMPALQAVAGLRFARILIFEKSYQEALLEIDTLIKRFDEVAIDMVKAHELKGDIYVALGRQIMAAKSYQKARLLASKQDVVNHFLDMKITENGIKS